MNQELMKEFKADLKEFREMTEKFYAKEVSVKDYKGFSGGFGKSTYHNLPDSAVS